MVGIRYAFNLHNDERHSERNSLVFSKILLLHPAGTSSEMKKGINELEAYVDS